MAVSTMSSDCGPTRCFTMTPCRFTKNIVGKKVTPKVCCITGVTCPTGKRIPACGYGPLEPDRCTVIRAGCRHSRQRSGIPEASISGTALPTSAWWKSTADNWRTRSRSDRADPATGPYSPTVWISRPWRNLAPPVSPGCRRFVRSPGQFGIGFDQRCIDLRNFTGSRISRQEPGNPRVRFHGAEDHIHFSRDFEIELLG